jgi:hypothetical protein
MKTLRGGSYCVVDKEGKAIEGPNKASVVLQVFEFWLEDISSDSKLLWTQLKCKYSLPYSCHSYLYSSFTPEGLRRDIINYLYRKLPEYGYRLYREEKYPG